MDDRSFYERMFEILTDLGDTTINNITKNDKKAAAYSDEVEETEMKYYKMCEELSVDDRETVDNYISALERLYGRVYMISYFAGMTDMYKMIRVFEKNIGCEA